MIVFICLAYWVYGLTLLEDLHVYLVVIGFMQGAKQFQLNNALLKSYLALDILL